MVAMPAVEHPLPEDDLLQTFLSLETPLGYKAELIEGEIIVTPPPDGSHETTFASLIRQFIRESATDLDIAGTKGLITPLGHFIPDGTVSPVGHFHNAEPWADTTGVLLVFEVTSGNPTKDRDAKRRGYAAGLIPCYLLIDRSRAEAVLFTDPVDGDYAALTKVPFGKPLDLPAPFSFALDTTPLR
jgi:Uma2 family endonuclease